MSLEIVRRHSVQSVSRPSSRSWMLASLLVVGAAWSCSVGAPADAPDPASADQTSSEGASADGQPRSPLWRVQSWAVQLQGLEKRGAVRRLVSAPVDMVVIDAVRSVRGMEAFPINTVVRGVRSSRGRSEGARKLCLAYLNVGQAESYRTYWGDDWVAPTELSLGSPPFLVTVDPDGWRGDYPVAFWDPAWQEVLWGSPEAALDRILADGFDGVYLDWVAGYAEPAVVEAARLADVDPAAAMVDLLAELRRYARRHNPDFLMIAQNGVGLFAEQPRFARVIDGFAHEDLSFHGDAQAKWNQAHAGDKPAPTSGPWSTAQLGAALRSVRELGVPVFTLDYAAEPLNIVAAERTSRALGLVPFVTRTPLDRLPSRQGGQPATPTGQ